MKRAQLTKTAIVLLTYSLIGASVPVAAQAAPSSVKRIIIVDSKPVSGGGGTGVGRVGGKMHLEDVSLGIVTD